MSVRAWQLGDVGQTSQYTPERGTLFTPAPVSHSAPSNEAAEEETITRSVGTYTAAPRYGTCEEEGCGKEFRAPKRGRIPRTCPDHRRHHVLKSGMPLEADLVCGKCHRTFHHRRTRGKFPKNCPSCRGVVSSAPRFSPALGLAIVSFLESGGLLWKTPLGDYLAMQPGCEESHASTLAGAISSANRAPRRSG